MDERVFKLTSRLKLESGVDGSVNVAIDTHSGVISSCNPTAAVLLERLQSSATLDDLAAELTSTWLIAKDQAKDDASQFVMRLSAMGLLDDDT